MSTSTSAEETLTLAVTGVTGRMGGETIAAVRERGHEVFGLSRAGDRIDGIETYRSGEAAAALAERAPDALVDFSVPEGSLGYLSACAETATPAVVGTTGFDSEGLAAFDRAAETVPVLKASNFARGVQTLRTLVEEAAASLEGYDIELTETHHNGKRDAPSGTAKSLLAAVEDGAGEHEFQYGREGVHPRRPAEVGVHVRRAGNVRGEHELLFAGNDEVVTLTHRAESRRAFADGAVDAAEWLAERPPGRYEFADVLGGER
jgi:4-hydroxy-tetrahydrodipicolinate reductase